MDPQALDLVPRVYEAATRPEAWDPFLEDLARRMRGSVPALFLIEPESGVSLLERAPEERAISIRPTAARSSSCASPSARALSMRKRSATSTA